MMAESSLTESQDDMIETLDDVAEHVAWEFEPDDYEGISTIGFAHIKMDGRSSFVQRVKSLVMCDEIGWVKRSQRNPMRNGPNGPFVIEIGKLKLRLAPDHDSGYRLSITNVSDFRPGPEHQRMDVRERLHDLVLERLRYNGYCEDARRYSRMD